MIVVRAMMALSLGFLAAPCMCVGPIKAVAVVGKKAPKLFEIARRTVNSQMNWPIPVGGATNAFERLQRGVEWFNRLREAVKGRKPTSGASKKARHSQLLDEIFTCKPDDLKKTCFGRCGRHEGHDYAWCHTSSEKRNGEWSVCTCTLKEVIVDYLQIQKDKLLAKPVKPWTATELGLIVATAILSSAIAAGFVVIGVRMFRRHNDLPLPGNNQFVLNPVYQPPTP